MKGYIKINSCVLEAVSLFYDRFTSSIFYLCICKYHIIMQISSGDECHMNLGQWYCNRSMSWTCDFMALMSRGNADMCWLETENRRIKQQTVL